MLHYIYKTFSDDGLYYIGRHTTKYNDSYLGSGNWVKRCKRKGVKLQRVILEYCSTQKELIKREHEILKEHIDIETNMNEKTDSDGWTSETARRVGPKNGMYGKKHTKETIEKMRQNRKGKNVGHTRNVGENNPMFGKVKSEETRKKISEALKGIVRSEETRKKLSESSRGRVASEETRKKMSEARKEYLRRKKDGIQ